MPLPARFSDDESRWRFNHGTDAHSIDTNGFLKFSYIPEVHSTQRIKEKVTGRLSSFWGSAHIQGRASNFWACISFHSKTVAFFLSQQSAKSSFHNVQMYTILASTGKLDIRSTVAGLCCTVLSNFYAFLSSAAMLQWRIDGVVVELFSSLNDGPAVFFPTGQVRYSRDWPRYGVPEGEKKIRRRLGV